MRRALAFLIGLFIGVGAVSLAAQITNVLNSAADLSGKTLVTAETNRSIGAVWTYSNPQKFAPGSAAAPGLTSTTDTTTGWVLGSASIAGAISGTSRLTLDGSGLTIYGTTILNTSGKIPSISATYFTSLDGSALTNLPSATWASWTSAALAGDWTNTGAPYRAAASYRKDPTSKLVYIAGDVSSAGGATGAGTPIFTLPAGSRPATDVRVTTLTAAEFVIAVHVTVAGLVYAEAGGGATTSPLHLNFSFALD